LRKIKPYGIGDIAQERFDSVFRRNLLATEKPQLGGDKKRIKKAKFKWHESTKGKLIEKM